MGRQGEPKKGLNFSPCASSRWVRLECGVKCGVWGWFRLAYSELCTQLPPGSAPGGQAHPGGGGHDLLRVNKPANVRWARSSCVHSRARHLQCQCQPGTCSSSCDCGWDFVNRL